MSEYIFNTASNDGQNGGPRAASTCIVTFIETLAELDANFVGSNRPLKLPSNAWELQVTIDDEGQPISLGEIVNSLYEHGATRDLATFFEALQTYSPAVDQLDDAIIEAILRLEITAPVVGHEAVYDAICAAGFDAIQSVVTNGTLISLAYPLWDFDQALVICGETEISIDHASCPEHVDAIALRQINNAREGVTRRNFEATRMKAFPSLIWGQDVIGQIHRFPADFLGLAFRRFAALDDIARRWAADESPMPNTGSLELRGESKLTMDNYSEDRNFRSSTGDMRIYETHVWIDSGNRVHLILDHETRTIEIGYVGPHLRTWKY